MSPYAGFDRSLLDLDNRWVPWFSQHPCIASYQKSLLIIIKDFSTVIIYLCIKTSLLTASKAPRSNKVHVHLFPDDRCHKDHRNQATRDHRQPWKHQAAVEQLMILVLSCWCPCTICVAFLSPMDLLQVHNPAKRLCHFHIYPGNQLLESILGWQVERPSSHHLFSPWDFFTTSENGNHLLLLFPCP